MCIKLTLLLVVLLHIEGEFVSENTMNTAFSANLAYLSLGLKNKILF